MWAHAWQQGCDTADRGGRKRGQKEDVGMLICGYVDM